MEQQAVSELPPDEAVIHASKAILLAFFGSSPSVLVLNRNPSGRSDFPGGQAELVPGTDVLETPKATVVRETKEETGIILPEGALRRILTVGPTRKKPGLWITRHLLYAVVAREADPIPKVRLSHEHRGLRWLPPGDLESLFEKTHWKAGVRQARSVGVFTMKRMTEA